MERARAGRVVEPSEEVQTRDLQRLAEPADRPDVAVFGEKTNLASPPARKAAAFFRISRSAWSRATSFFKAEILARSAQQPVPGKAVAGGAVRSRIQRRNTLSATSMSREACVPATPRSVTSLAASILNSRPNFRVVGAVMLLTIVGRAATRRDLPFEDSKRHSRSKRSLTGSAP